MATLSKKILLKLYLKKSKSAQEIADVYKCSVNKVRYWMDRCGIKRRTISEAIYRKNNPNGDPFKIRYPNTIKAAVLFGLGLGLYWGEGTKADEGTVRLGNADSDLIKKFIQFLVEVFCIKKKDLKFSLQLFNDISEAEALEFWIKELRIARSQFYKSTIMISARKGSYRKKSKFGVLTVYYHNKKMRDNLINILQREK